MCYKINRKRYEVDRYMIENVFESNLVNSQELFRKDFHTKG